MKKITLFLILIVIFLTHFQLKAQILEPANWPNTNWTINGAFSASGFILDPTTTANFSWDDDAAGSGSLFDDIAAESPVIDLTPAFDVGELQLQVQGNYVYRRAGDVLSLEWWDQSTGTWQFWEQFQNNSNNLDFKTCSGMQAYVSQPLIIATFTATQIQGFKYRIRYNDNGFDWGMCFESPTLVSISTATCIAVSGLNVDINSVTTSSIEASWTDNNAVSPANGWGIEVVPTGTAPTGVENYTALTNPYTITGLDPNTTYDVYIRALCDTNDLSEWIGFVTFTTNNVSEDNTCGGQFVDSGGIAGQYSNNEDIETTICPDVAGEVVTLNFLSFDTESCCDNLTIYDGDDTTGTNLGTYQGTDLPPTFTSTHPSGCLTLVFHSDGSVLRDGFVANIICGPPPTCFAVTNIQITNQTVEGATISWTDNNTNPEPVNGWSLEVVPTGQLATGVGQPATNPFTVTGLDPSTTYDVYVTAICDDDNGGEDPSFAIAASFSTLIAPPACGQVYVDSGGPDGNYSNGENETFVICPDVAGEVVTLQFLEFDTEAGFDDLTIFNGNSATGAPIGTFEGTALPPVITSTDPTGCLTVVFQSDGSVTRAGWLANVICAPPPTCFIPTNVNVSNITSTSAQFSWTENTPTPATTWNVEIVPAGTAPTGVGISTTNNPYTALDLDPDTDYDFYVQADCGNGDTSIWAGPLNFQTEISPPECGGVFVDDGGTNGNYSNGLDTITIICPEDPGDVVSVQFISFDTEAGFDNMSIFNGDSTAAPLLGIFEGTNLPPTFISSHPSGCLTFVFHSDGIVSRPGWEANVICAPPPTCFVVSDININGIDTNSAIVSWTDNNPVTPIGGWTIEYGPAGFAQGTGTEIDAPTNPFTLIDLTPSTNYDVYIRANCAADDSDSSLWFGPANFTTDDAPPPNDTCFTAVPLLVDVDCINTLGNNILATSSTDNEGEVLPDCADPAANGIGVFDALDVWFSFEVPATGNVVVETSPAGGMVDTVLAAYTGSCGNLVELDCQDDSVINPNSVDFRFSSITLQDLTEGEIIYLRVWSYDHFEYGNDQGAFNICVYGQSRGFNGALATEENTINDIQVSYYPNPVDNILTVTSEKNISQIAVYSLLGQEVIRKSFNDNNVTVDMQQLSQGTYFVKALINGKSKTFKVIKK